MKYKYIFLVFGLALLLTSTVHAASKEIIWGVAPYFDQAKNERTYIPLAKYIEKSTKAKVKLVYFDSYEKVQKSLVDGSVDVAFLAASLYVSTKKKQPDLGYLITAKNRKNGKTHYFSYILTHVDSQISSLSGLKGKSFAFVNKKSSSGYKYPMAFFKRENIVPEDYFSKVDYLKLQHE